MAPPKSLRALAKAIADVKKEVGDSAEHKQLLSSLEAVTKELGDDVAADASKARDNDDDDYSFDTAERRHRARNAERSADDASDAGGEA